LYRGELAGLNHSLVRLSFMKGYASRVVNDFVSFVNVEAHFSRLGLKVEDKEEPSFDSYRSALKIRISGSNGEVLTVGGIVFDDLLPRLSLINGFHFEAEPSGNLVLVQNEDKPGVIGDLGHFLGLKGVNIATFELSRNRRGGKAMSVIKTDQELSMADLEEMKRIPNLIQIQRVFL